MSSSKTNCRFRFSVFEVDPAAGELLRQGLRVKLQEQPFRLLVLLLERAGETVTREEIRQRLWPEDTFVEFDNSLNVAVRKLREALRDDAETPRFVETVPRRGYRFLAPVSPVIEPVTVEDDSQHTQASLSPAPPELPLRKPSWPPRTLILASLALLLLLALGVSLIPWRRSSFQLAPDDSIVLADFVNTTGDTVFDESLRQASAEAFGQSSLFRVLSERRTAAVLKEMGRSPDERFAGPVTIEVCRRAGSKVVVQGSISNLGTAYLIGLAAVRCDSGAPLALEQAQAAGKDGIIQALGDAASRLRARLGESLPTLHKYDVPLAEATTASLEALKAYSQALVVWDQQGDEASRPLFQHAVDLDPRFAKGYASLAVICHNLGENDCARSNATRAYELRDRVTEQERLSIESWYHRYVTGDLNKVAEIHRAWIATHPNSPGALANLGSAYACLGEQEKAADSYRESLRLDPNRASSYGNLAIALIQTNRLDEAGALLAEAKKRKLQAELLVQADYWLAFLHHDAAGMQQILLSAGKTPGAGPLMLEVQANSEAYVGRMKMADALTRQSAEQLQKEGDKETAASYLAEAALRDAEAGDLPGAQQDIRDADRLSRSDDIKTLESLVLARVGDIGRAEAMAEGLDKAHPEDTALQGYWLPTIRAAIELRKGRPSQAVERLKAAAPLEYAHLPLITTASLYPAYIRGQAYLAAGDPSGAAAEFQKLIDHAGLVANFPLGALARLGLARSHAAAHLASSRLEYAAFLELWKDAGPDAPVVKQAKAEYEKLP